MSEWKINNPFMKALFVMAAVWGVISTFYFLVGLAIGLFMEV